MRKKTMEKNNRGNALTTIILLILLMLLVVFFAYEIVFVDIFGIIKDDEKNPIDLYANLTDKSNQSYKNLDNSMENIEVIEPIINNQNYESEESITTTNHYYYNQLDKYAKIIYKALEDNMENMQNGIYKIDFKTKFNDLLNSNNGEEKLNIAFQSAWNAFSYDHVDVFYIDVTKLILTTQTTTIASYSRHEVELSSGENSNYLDNGITSTAELQKRVKYVSKVRDNIVSQLSGYSEYEQIKYLHNWMIDNFKYDTTLSNSNIHDIYGAFANKKIVCEGYARAFKYILDGLGINSVLVSGTATNSSNNTESHAWNYVEINGKWYAIDVTWDDPVITGNGKLTDELRYKYFLKGSNEFLKNHKEDGCISENSIRFNFPTIEKTNY